MPAPISPMYKRLRPGPHHLARSQVLRHQRLRIHGAIVEAVSQCGYEAVTVRQVVGLAGVSRRSFYDQFANKEDCFLATFDVLAGRGMRRVGEAYRAAGTGLEDRLRSAFGELADAATSHRKATLLVLVEAQSAGPAAQLRLRRATGACERLLSRSFIDSPQASPLPGPVVRALAGGLHGSLSRQARELGAADSCELAEEMLRWTLLFQTPAAERMARRVTERVVRRMREAPGTLPPGRGEERAIVGRGHDMPPEAACEDARERLLQNALRLAVLDDYSRLTAPQIAHEANVSIDAFFELFADKSECFLAALDMLGEELLGIASDPGLVSSDWPQAVRRVIAELMRFLASHPLYARTISQQAFTAGPDAARRNLELANGIATLLTEGAPRRAGSRLVVEGLAGAIWHTVRCQVAGARIQLLPALSDYLSYVALAPFMGADAAAEMVSDERPA